MRIAVKFPIYEIVTVSIVDFLFLDDKQFRGFGIRLSGFIGWVAGKPVPHFEGTYPFG
jgi:hypothetical protein